MVGNGKFGKKDRKGFKNEKVLLSLKTLNVSEKYSGLALMHLMQSKKYKVIL